MATNRSPTIRRILREATELSDSPAPEYTAYPLESDLFEWHFTFRGPPKSAYADGIYHGRIVLPPMYPLRPPSFRFSTPSGRFEVNREICLSISGHHEETWQPAWGVRTALVALRSFMETDARGQLGGLDATEAVRTRLAQESRLYRCPTCAKTNLEIIAACEETCKESDSPVQAVVVPDDLKMGWRDELAPGQQQQQHQPVEGSLQPDHPPGSAARTDPELAELAEGFVRTTAPAAPATPALQPQPNPPPGGVLPEVPPAQPAVAAAAAAAYNLQQVQPRGGNDAPLWLDRMIGMIAAILIAMIFRLVFRDS